MKVSNYPLGGSPFLFVEAQEIKRAVQNLEVDEEVTKLRWNCIEGIVELAEFDNDGRMIPKYVDIAEFLEVLPALGKKVLVCAELFDMAFEDLNVVQQLLNMSYILKHNQICLCVVSTNAKTIPSPLEKLFTVIDFPLPTAEEFRSFLKSQCEMNEIEYIESVADACVGLSLEEGENAMVKMLLDHGECNMESVLEVKKQMFAKTNFMKLVMPEKEEMLGGLEEGVDYMKRRATISKQNPNAPKARAYFLIGVQGCGKSLFSRIAGSINDCPVIYGDIGGMKGGIVGETEKNMRTFTKIGDSIGKAILVLDEIEKSLSGSTGQSLDGGTSAGQLGHLLTWLQERTGEAIVIATANDISLLPPEFLRAGRWDAMFFVGFPNAKERKSIIEIMNKKWNSNLPTTDEFIAKLDKFTGAEIEQVAKDSHFYDDLDEVINMVPRIWNMKRKAVEEVMKFGSQVRNASKPDVIPKIAPEAKRTVGVKKNGSLDDLKAKIKEKIL